MPSREALWGKNIQAAESHRAASLQGGIRGGISVVCTGGFADEALQLWKEVNQHGELIIARLVAVLKGSQEEKVYLEQEPEGSN